MPGQSRTARIKLRIGLYSGGAVLAGVLLWLGFFYVPPAGLDTRLESVFAASREKDFPRARSLLSAIEDDFPRHVKVYLARGYLDEVENDLEAARRTYLEAADLVIDPPQRREILLSVADLDRRRGNRVEAQAMLDRLSQECGESVRSRQLRISLLVEEGRITDALREVTRMAEENPGNPLASRLRRQLEGLAAGVSARGLPSGSSSSTTR